MSIIYQIVLDRRYIVPAAIDIKSPTPFPIALHDGDLILKIEDLNFRGWEGYFDLQKLRFVWLRTGEPTPENNPEIFRRVL